MNSRQVILVSIIAIILPISPAIMGPMESMWALTNLSFYLFLIGFASLLIVSTISLIHFPWKKYGLFIALIFVYTIGLFKVFPPSFKIFSDEANVVNTSFSLVQERKAQIALSKITYKGESVVLDHAVPGRPLTVAFLGSIFHRFLGYDFKNLFRLNVLLYFLSLCAIFFLCVSSFGPWKSLLASIGLGFSPVVIFSFGSAGIEAAFLAFFLLLLLPLKKIWQGDSSNTLTWALFSTLLFFFLNTRYEAVVIAIVLLICLLYTSDRCRRM